MPYKVLILSNTVFSILKFRKELVFSLLDKGYEVYISVPYHLDSEQFKQWGCTYIPLDFKGRGINPIMDMELMFRYWRLYQDIRPDVIFSFTIKPNIYGSIVSKITGSKQICTITGLGQAFLKDNLLNRLVTRLYRFAFSHHRSVIFQNQTDLDFFKRNKLFLGDSILVNGSGVNLSQFVLESLPESGSIKFLFLSRIMRNKGIDLFISLADHYRLNRPELNLKFIVAGYIEESHYEPVLKQKEADGTIQYVGYQSDIRQLMQSSHCIVFPSLGGEGIPNVLLEAFAMGRFCIASDVPGPQDVIKNDVNGYLFHPGDLGQMITRVDQFLELSNEKKIAMALEGRLVVERDFNRENVIRQYLDLCIKEGR